MFVKISTNTWIFILDSTTLWIIIIIISIDGILNIPSVHLSYNKLVLALVHLEITSSQKIVWPFHLGRDCSEASCLHFTCLLHCMRFKVMHTRKVRHLNYRFHDLNVIILNECSQTNFGFSRQTYKLQAYVAVLFKCLYPTMILRICLSWSSLFLLFLKVFFPIQENVHYWSGTVEIC